MLHEQYAIVEDKGLWTFLLASSDSHSCGTLAEYAGVATPTELSRSGKAK